jgi:hypothetical protein
MNLLQIGRAAATIYFASRVFTGSAAISTRDSSALGLDFFRVR